MLNPFISVESLLKDIPVDLIDELTEPDNIKACSVLLNIRLDDVLGDRINDLMKRFSKSPSCFVGSIL